MRIGEGNEMIQPPILTIDFTRPQDMAKVLPCKAILSSYRSGWQQIDLQVYDCSAEWETPVHTSTHHLLGINLTDGSSLERRIGDQQKTESVLTGECALVPEGVEHWCAFLANRGRFMILEIEHNLISQLAWEAMDPDRTELLPTFLQPDPMIFNIGRTLGQMLENQPSNDALYVETLTQTLGLHLLKYYAVRRLTQKLPEEGLSPQQMKQVLDYMHHCPEQDILLTRIPILLGMSQYRFNQCFQHSMGMSAYQYLMQQRVKKARALLARSPQLSLDEVAKQCGFNDGRNLAKSLSQLAQTVTEAV